MAQGLDGGQPQSRGFTGIVDDLGHFLYEVGFFSGSDQGQLAPMVEQHRQRYGEAPQEALVDGGFAKH